MELDIIKKGDTTYIITEELLKNIIDNLIDTDLKKNLYSALYKKYNFGLSHNDYCLYKVYHVLTEWSIEEIDIINRNFPDNIYIERPIRYDNLYVTISEDGVNNRPWKKEELELIEKIFYGR